MKYYILLVRLQIKNLFLFFFERIPYDPPSSNNRLTTGQAQMVKNLPAMLETQVPSLGQEDPLEKEMTGNPFLCSGLENTLDRKARSATVCGWQRVGHG